MLIVAGLVLFTGCSQSDSPHTAAAETKTLYTCGMHPTVIQDHPGNCPICGMKLTPIRRQAGDAQTGERKIKFYKSTMNPGETSPTPAKDSMGMEMAPVYEDAGGAANASAIAIDPVTIQNMNLRTAVLARGPLRKVIRTVGTIDYNETATAEVTTKYKGWIEKLHADATGKLVHRGEPLFEVYSPELYSAQAEFLLALNQTSTNSGAVLRELALSKLKFFDISEAQIAELERTRKPLRTLSVVAPMDGFVTEKMVVQGQMVDVGMKLYRLSDLGIVWVIAQIYEQDLPFVQLGQEAVVKLSSMSDREFRGRVTFVYPTVDEKTRTARVRMEFENPGYFLKPGMFVSVQLHSEIGAATLLVPDSAVLRSGAKNTVFLALDGGRFDARNVVLGAEAEEGMLQVVGGLHEGERVVTSGQFMLDSESQLREAIEKMRGQSPATDNEMKSTNSVSKTSKPVEVENAVYVCPMPEHVSIIYDHAGKCPICSMALVPVTTSSLAKLQPGGKVLYYTCPMPEHAGVHEDKPGKCPLCAMTLIPVMTAPKPAVPSEPNSVAKFYCPMHPTVVSNAPGICPVCQMDLVLKEK